MNPATGVSALSPGASAYLGGASELAASAEITTNYPIGTVNFNRPFVVIDENAYSHDDEEMTDAKIITVLDGNDYPVVVSFWDGDKQCVAQFDEDGNTDADDYTAKNIEDGPITRYVLITRDGRELSVDDVLYKSDAEARNSGVLSSEIAGIFPVTIDPVQAQDDSEESDETDQSSADALTEIYINGSIRRVGDTVRTYRRGFGYRDCTVVKIRSRAGKSLYVNPNDGNNSYWALNRNIQY